MKSKNLILLIFLLVLPLSFALEEQNLNYDSTQNTIKIGYDNLNRVVSKNSTADLINYSYDSQLQGTLSNINFGNSTYKYNYDDKLRIIEEKRVIDGTEFNKKYFYDSEDRLIRLELSSGQSMNFYYSPQNKIQKINGFINDTRYNPAGNPLNRTYFNNKVTQFDYNPINLRLKQIKTDTIQQLNYSYDNTGNILAINDSINNRSYQMGYDNLNRLTNVSINGFNWVYSYDAIGNILKIVRNYSQTTSFKYEGLAHAFTKVITKDTGIDVYRPIISNGTNRSQIVQFYLVNEKNDSISQVNYTVEFGDGSSVNGSNINLAFKGFSLVNEERNYSTGGSYKVNITGRANTTATDYEPLKLLFGTIANSLLILKKNATTIIAELDAYNSINQLSENWGWNCSHSLISHVSFNMSANENLMVIIEHNFTFSNGINLTCRVNSSDGNQSQLLNFDLDGVKIEGYNSTKPDIDTVLVKFQIKNYYGTLNNINWSVQADNLIYNQSGISLNQGQSTYVTQELNFTNAGLKQIKITIGSGNFTDTYTENVRLYAIGINQFINYVKNGTTRIFNFIVKNDWANLSAYWNFTNPALTNSVNLSQNESLIVVIEENYAQGQKDLSVNAFNNTFLEDIELDVFRVKHIGINRFETLFENTSKAVINALVVNNINPLNISWKLNNTEALIVSTQNLELNTSEQAFVVIESNFSSSGIYPLYLTINSSTFNDNQTGVAVS